MTQAPNIIHYVPETMKKINFLVDTGAKPNLIKESFIPNKGRINPLEVLQLSGITANRVYTLGTIELNIFNYPVIFHVVHQEFPIEQDGILGRDFLKQTKTKINFEENCIEFGKSKAYFNKNECIKIPGRSVTVGYVRIKNDIDEGYLPQLDLKTGVYAGKGLVKNIEGKAYIPFHNTLEQDVIIEIPTLAIEECEIYTPPQTVCPVTEAEPPRNLSFPRE